MAQKNPVGRVNRSATARQQANKKQLIANTTLGMMFGRAGLPTENMLPQWRNVFEFAENLGNSIAASVELFGRLTGVLKITCPEKQRDFVAITLSAQANAVEELSKEYEAILNRIPERSGPVRPEEENIYYELGDLLTVLAARISSELVPNNHSLSMVVSDVHAQLKAAKDDKAAAALYDILELDRKLMVPTTPAQIARPEAEPGAVELAAEVMIDDAIEQVQ